MNAKPPFLHARVSVELPFRLLVPSGLYFIELSPGVAQIVIVDDSPAWVLAYRAASTNPNVLRDPQSTARTTIAPDHDSEINEWVVKSALDRAVVLPANTILELRIGFSPETFPADLAEWTRDRDVRHIIVFLVNQFLQRYQVACGFTPPAGFVGAVSEVELGYFAAQLYSDDIPKSPLVSILPASPGKPRVVPFSLPQDMGKRFKELQRTPAIPLWLELAHEAHSLLYRRRLEQSIMAWFQSLEVGINQAERLSAKALKSKSTVEGRLSHLLYVEMGVELDRDMMQRLITVRKLRNRIVHEGHRLPFNDTQADETAVSVIQVLKDLERLLVHLVAQTQSANVAQQVVPADGPRPAGSARR